MAVGPVEEVKGFDCFKFESGLFEEVGATAAGDGEKLKDGGGRLQAEDVLIFKQAPYSYYPWKHL